MTEKTQTPAVPDVEVVIIGAGIAGIQQLYWVRRLGLSVQVFEAGSGVGGTWYWNRYPGCRLDSESNSYAFSFSPEVLQEWDWSEMFASQPELERHMNFVVDRLGMRDDIRLNATVTSAVWDENSFLWTVTLESGETIRCRYVLAAVGVLPGTAPYIPDFPGVRSFEGETYHSTRWPDEPVALAGKRVGVIGTGSTGVQIIQTIAPEVGHLTVFQRTPTYVLPLRNQPVSDEMQAQWKRDYERMFAWCAQTPKGFLHTPDPRKVEEVPYEERLEIYQRLWSRPGFEKYQGVFHDIFSNPAANKEYADFIRGKIREVVKDPDVVSKLLPPEDLPFSARRIPLDTGYYEAYNRPNVELVDVKANPIAAITPKGVRTEDGVEHELDVLIYATGFDSFTGGFTRIDIRGEGGVSFKELWEREGPVNFMSMMVAGFPNFYTLVNRLAGNFSRTTDVGVRWITDMLSFLYRTDVVKVAITQDAQDKWVEHEHSFGKGREFMTKHKSWFNGGNIPGKVSYPPYFNSLPAYILELDEVTQSDYSAYEQIRDPQAGLPEVRDVHAFHYADSKPAEEQLELAEEASVG